MRQMTDHVLEVIKGPKPLLSGGAFLDRQAVFNGTELGLISGGIVFQGRCVSLNASGEFILGVGNAAVPLFLLSNSDDYDVKNDGGTLSTDYGAWSPGMPTGKLQAVCGLSASELETTEFITSENYAINAPLTAPVSTGVAATMLSQSGKLTGSGIKPYSHNVVGWVSQPFTAATPTKSAHGKPVLRFWCDFLPKITGIAEPTWV